MRHLCEIHCPIIQEWTCTNGSCEVSFDRNPKCVEGEGTCSCHLSWSRWQHTIDGQQWLPTDVVFISRKYLNTTEWFQTCNQARGGSNAIKHDKSSSSRQTAAKKKKEDSSLRPWSLVTPSFDPVKQRTAPPVSKSARPLPGHNPSQTA